MKKIFSSVVILIASINLQASIPNPSSMSFHDAYEVAKNPSASLTQRWSSLLQAADVANGDEFKKITDFAKDKDWFMRNASLVALDKTGNDIVYDQAKALIKDKALVVRSAAADILMRLNNDEVRRIFSQEMDQKYNFSGQQSLWIRPQMMKHLVQNPTKNERDFFVKYIYDKDIQVASLSAQALEKITQIRFSGKNSQEVLDQWKKAVKMQKW